MNTYNGNGAATSKNAGSTNSNNFGLGLIGTSEGNLVEKNKIGGNINGLLISSPRPNVIRRNLIAGNPPTQVSKDFGKAIGADIQDATTAGTVSDFAENYCLTYAGNLNPAPCPGITIRRWRDRWDNDSDNDGDNRATGIAAGRARMPFSGAFKHTNFTPNRLAFPQPRLINAVFPRAARPLPPPSASPGTTAIKWSSAPRPGYKIITFKHWKNFRRQSAASSLAKYFAARAGECGASALLAVAFRGRSV